MVSRRAADQGSCGPPQPSFMNAVRGRDRPCRACAEETRGRADGALQVSRRAGDRRGTHRGAASRGDKIERKGNLRRGFRSGQPALPLADFSPAGGAVEAALRNLERPYWGSGLFRNTVVTILARRRASTRILWRRLQDDRWPYAPGNRGLWRKAKALNPQEFVVVGWSDPEGSRPHLGALLLGVLHRRRQARLCRPCGHRDACQGSRRSAAPSGFARAQDVVAERPAATLNALRLAARSVPRPLGRAAARL
jgi:hypothetical protein